jgi:hypothetical protein
MKKIISVAVAFMFAVMLCACGDVNDVSNVSSDDSNSISDNSSASFETGKVLDNKYTNKFLGVGCTLDSQWTFYTDEQIKEANNITTDMMDDDIKKQLENANIVYDMMAASESGATVNINIEKLGVGGAFTDVETYLSAQTDELKSALEQLGLSNVTTEIKTFDFAGSSEKGIYVHASIEEVIFEEAIITLKRGTRFANITVATPNGDLNSILDKFYAI